jgi:CheY-like chemotaxis protein
MLEDLGHHVMQARSGEEALALARQGRHLDLVITDQAMPGMSGSALIRQLAAERPTLPAILASGYAGIGPETAAAARLSKPFDQEALMRAVAEVLARSGSGVVVPLRPRAG